MDKKIKLNYPVCEVVEKRWSPVIFSSKEIEDQDLFSLFEAARLAPSCFNEQPWRFIFAKKQEGEKYQKLLSCLVDANQEWAKHAPVLMLGIVKKTFTQTGKENHHARHDLGLAMGNFSAEATARGIYLHQMGGILPKKAVELFDLSDDLDVVTGIAVGYLGDIEKAQEPLQQREMGKRERLDLDQLFLA